MEWLVWKGIWTRCVLPIAIPDHENETHAHRIDLINFSWNHVCSWQIAKLSKFVRVWKHFSLPRRIYFRWSAERRDGKNWICWISVATSDPVLLTLVLMEFIWSWINAFTESCSASLVTFNLPETRHQFSFLIKNFIEWHKSEYKNYSMWRGNVFHFFRCSHNPTIACKFQSHLKYTRKYKKKREIHHFTSKANGFKHFKRSKPSDPLSRSNLRCSRWSWLSSGIFIRRWSIAADVNNFCSHLIFPTHSEFDSSSCEQVALVIVLKKTKLYYCAVIYIVACLILRLELWEFAVCVCVHLRVKHLVTSRSRINNKITMEFGELVEPETRSFWENYDTFEEE